VPEHAGRDCQRGVARRSELALGGRGCAAMAPLCHSGWPRAARWLITQGALGGWAQAAASAMAVALAAVHCTCASTAVPDWPAWIRLAIICKRRPYRNTGSARASLGRGQGGRAGVATDEPSRNSRRGNLMSPTPRACHQRNSSGRRERDGAPRSTAPDPPYRRPCSQAQPGRRPRRSGRTVRGGTCPPRTGTDQHAA
jgi:hypothetical protein